MRVMVEPATPARRASSRMDNPESSLALRRIVAASLVFIDVSIYATVLAYFVNERVLANVGAKGLNTHIFTGFSSPELSQLRIGSALNLIDCINAGCWVGNGNRGTPVLNLGMKWE
jgi:hypothetical protein